MKSIKGLALGAALAGVVFTGAANADAATIGKDVAGTKYQEATTKLAALGITKGYPDGTVRPDENVTRAQTAAFMIRALNYQLAMDQSTTVFNDVAYEHPLSGAVQLASGKGIIKGYLDGSFRAEESVTIAQASAILVRMLGYSPAINEADFPNSHLSKAAELGILKNVKADVNAPAKRGDIMLMVSNALTVDIMKQTEWGSDHKWEEKKDDNLLTEYFDLTVIDTRKDHKEKIDTGNNYEDMPTVVQTVRTKIGSLKADELEFDSLGGVHTLNEMFNADDFLGQQVQMWVDQDEDYVAYIADSKDQKVIFDQFDKWKDEKETNIKLDNGDDYDILKDADIYYNLDKKVTFDKWDKKIAGTAMVKLVLDSSDDVVAMVVTDLGASDAKFGVVDEVETGKEIVNFMDGSATNNQIKLKGEDYVVIRDGKAAKLEDIEKEDVINWFEKNKDYYILATSEKASGKVEDVKYTKEEVSSYDLIIDGKKYDVADKATFSENKNEDIDDVTTDDLDEMDEVEVTLYLDAAGDVRHIVSGELDSTAGNVAVVTKNIKWLVQDDKWELTVVNEFGKEIKWRFEADDIDLNGKAMDELDGGKYKDDNDSDVIELFDVENAPNKLIAIEYSQNKDGELKSIDILSTNPHKDKYELRISQNKGVDFDKYENNIDFKGDGTYNVTRNTVIFDVKDSQKTWDKELDDVDVVNWENIKNKDDINLAAYKVKSNGRDLEYMFVLDSDSSLTSKGEYGYVTGFKKVGRDDAIRITRIDGESVTLIYDKKDVEVAGGISLNKEDLAKGHFVRYTVDTDGEIDEMQILATAGTKGGHITNLQDKVEWSIDKIATGIVDKSTSSTIVLDAGNVVVNKDTVYVDLIDDGEMAIVSGVNVGDKVMAIDTDDDGNAADVVVIIKEDQDKAAAEEKAEAIEKAVKAAEEAITALPVAGSLTLDNKGDVEAARTLVTKAQTLDSKATIAGLDTLVAAEAKIAGLVADKALAEAKQAAEDAITALPEAGLLTLANKGDVEEARALVTEAEELNKDVVITGIDTLVAAEAKIAGLEVDAAVKAVNDATTKLATKVALNSAALGLDIPANKADDVAGYVLESKPEVTGYADKDAIKVAVEEALALLN